MKTIEQLSSSLGSRSSGRLAFWSDHVKQLEQSALSRVAYCKAQGLNYEKFGYWLKKLKRVPQKLIGVQLVENPAGSTLQVLCTVEFRQGISVKVHDRSVLSCIFQHLN